MLSLIFFDCPFFFALKSNKNNDVTTVTVLVHPHEKWTPQYIVHIFILLIIIQIIIKCQQTDQTFLSQAKVF